MSWFYLFIESTIFLKDTSAGIAARGIETYTMFSGILTASYTIYHRYLLSVSSLSFKGNKTPMSESDPYVSKLPKLIREADLGPVHIYSAGILYLTNKQGWKLQQHATKSLAVAGKIASSTRHFGR